jgi:AhpD family alkylhydroperoxidase
MMKKNEDPILSEKEQEIIAVGASVASGCLPCTKFHLRAAAGVGAGEEEILQAVGDAARVRRAATELMVRAGGLPSADTVRENPDPAGAPSLIREFVAIAAAYAVNCSTSLGAHMTAARSLGATDEQMFAAIQIACAIRDVACQKAKATAGAILGVSEEEAVSCGCGDDDATKKAPGTGDGDCHCRPSDTDDPNHPDQK